MPEGVLIRHILPLTDSDTTVASYTDTVGHLHC